jgi:isocitrate/isopropylmalate dehydrogenase
MSRSDYTVACLSGNGVGPELVAEATRAVRAASRLHGFFVDDEHVAFGSDALMRYGHPYPPSSRRAVLDSDAVLVAPGTDEPFDTLEDDLDLRASLTRIRFDGRFELSIVSPLDEDDWAWVAVRAFEIARAGRAHVTLVGLNDALPDAVERAVAAHDAFGIERLATGDAVRGLVATPQRFDVVLCVPEAAQTLADVAACTSPGRVVAWGQLSHTGPGLFGATIGRGDDVAGYDVVDPAPMLLAAALLLGEGLGERRAAATLARALGRTHPGDRPSTRGFGDRVLAGLPLALDVEHREVA